MSQHTAPAGLRGFWHSLPRDARWLLAPIIVDFIGNGLVLPFLVIYLHEVRHFSLPTVGVLSAIPALVGLLVVGPAGAIIDRIGPRRVFLVALAAMMVCEVGLAFTTQVWEAVIVLTCNGIAGGVVWPAVGSLIGTVVPAPMRQRFYGLNFTLLNVGIGIGGILGGLFVDVHRPSTFTTIYLIDAVTFVAPIAVFLGPLRHLDKVVPPAPAAGEAAAVSYRTLLRDRSLRMVLLLTFAAGFVGYGQLSTGVPAFARAEGRISTEAIGMAFAVNTLLIVVLQLFVLQRIEGRRRTRVLMVMSAVWAVAFVAMGMTGLVPGTLLASVLLATCFGIFGLGETLYQPTLPAMVNDLSPDHLRGRYNAAMAGAFSLAQVVGPVVAGFLIGHALSSAYIGVLLVGCVAVALIARALDRRLPAEVNGLLAVSAGGAPAERDGAVTCVGEG